MLSFDDVNKIEYNVNQCEVYNLTIRELRNTIKKMGGTMPEDLITPDKSLKELEKNIFINKMEDITENEQEKELNKAFKTYEK